MEAQVDRAPEAIALSGSGRALSYRALDERANQVAHHLRRLGVGPDMAVAICVDRSPDLVVGLLGILKAGAAYVPLDPSLPPARLAFAIEDSQACALVTEERFRSLVPASSVPALSLDGEKAILDREPVTRLSVGERSSHHRAYIAYTSGSSGIAKGVEVEHRSVANAIGDVVSRLRLGPADVWTAITTVAFDVASLEIWGALAAGARLEMVDGGAVADGERLAAAVRDAGTTVLAGTPTLWRNLLESGWSGQPGLKMICGGEPLTRDLADALLQRGAELWNQYGPTEATMYATTEQVTRDEAVPTIGRPIANVRVYVLDARGEPAPIGMAGELWIAGVQVARGYLNRPDETARVFEADPWVPGDRRYRTGDLARYRSDGRLEYLGRLDTQVKIRGYRVELREIETAIESHPDVRWAVVLAPTAGNRGRGLTAYLVVRDRHSPPTARRPPRLPPGSSSRLHDPGGFHPVGRAPGDLERQSGSASRCHRRGKGARVRDPSRSAAHGTRGDSRPDLGGGTEPQTGRSIRQLLRARRSLAPGHSSRVANPRGPRGRRRTPRPVRDCHRRRPRRAHHSTDRRRAFGRGSDRIPEARGFGAPVVLAGADVVPAPARARERGIQRAGILAHPGSPERRRARRGFARRRPPS